MVSHWDTIADKYDDFYALNNSWKLRRKLICLSSKIAPKDVVVELGCGTGVLTQEIASRSCSIYAYDSSAKMIELARKKAPDVTYVRGDAHRIYQLDNYVDRVTGLYILQYLVVGQMVKEIRRVLKSGGTMTFVEINYLNPFVWLLCNSAWARKVFNRPQAIKRSVRDVLLIRKYLKGFTDIEIIPFEFGWDKLNKLERIPVLKWLAGSIYIKAVKK